MGFRVGEFVWHTRDRLNPTFQCRDGRWFDFVLNISTKRRSSSVFRIHFRLWKKQKIDFRRVRVGVMCARVPSVTHCVRFVHTIERRLPFIQKFNRIVVPPIVHRCAVRFDIASHPMDWRHSNHISIEICLRVMFEYLNDFLFSLFHSKW